MESEELNFYRLVKLVLVEGTKVVRDCVLDNLPPHIDSIYHALQHFRPEIQKCKTARVLNENQFRLLYPSNGVHATPESFDLSVWLLLARKVTTTKFSDKDWNKKKVKPDQLDWEHDLIRIREIRNEISHSAAPVLDSISFESRWSSLAGAIRRRDVTADVESYRNLALDRSSMRIAELELKDQVQQDQMNFLNVEIARKHGQNRFFAVLIVVVVVLCFTALVVFILFPTHDCSKKVQFIPVGLIGVLKYLDRRAWGAADSRGPLKPLRSNISIVALGHTAFLGVCYTLQYCCMEVQQIQQMVFDQWHFADLAYHFLIDSNGFVYQGIRLDQQSVAINNWTYWGENVIFIALLGNFMFQQPTDIALASLDILLNYLKAEHALDPHWVLYPLCELRPTRSPGIRLYEKIYEKGLREIYRTGNWNGSAEAGYFNCTFDD